MLKHIGIHKTLGVRYIVIFREVPNEPEFCLVVESDGLNPLVHDNLMSALESTECQSANHLGEALVRKMLTNGENMLQFIHNHGMMKKVSIDEVILTPTPGTKVGLREINNIINGKDPKDGVVAEGETKPTVALPSEPASSDAVAMAKKLLEQALKLDPSLVGKTIETPVAEIIAPVKKPRRRRTQNKA